MFVTQGNLFPRTVLRVFSILSVPELAPISIRPRDPASPTDPERPRPGKLRSLKTPKPQNFKTSKHQNFKAPKLQSQAAENLGNYVVLAGVHGVYLSTLSAQPISLPRSLEGWPPLQECVSLLSPLPLCHPRNSRPWLREFISNKRNGSKEFISTPAPSPAFPSPRASQPPDGLEALAQGLYLQSKSSALFPTQGKLTPRMVLRVFFRF